MIVVIIETLIAIVLIFILFALKLFPLIIKGIMKIIIGVIKIFKSFFSVIRDLFYDIFSLNIIKSNSDDFDLEEMVLGLHSGSYALRLGEYDDWLSFAKDTEYEQYDIFDIKQRKFANRMIKKTGDILMDVSENPYEKTDFDFKLWIEGREEKEEALKENEREYQENRLKSLNYLIEAEQEINEYLQQNNK